MIFVVPVREVTSSAASLALTAAGHYLESVDPRCQRGRSIVIDFGQALSSFGQVSFGSAHVASQRYTGSRELSHDTIILSHNTTIFSQPSLKTIQPFFGLRKALVGLGELGVKSRVHARLIFE